MLIDQILQKMSEPDTLWYQSAYIFTQFDIFYISTAFLTAVSPDHGIIFILVAISVNHLTSNFFAALLEPIHRITSFIPLNGRILDVGVSVLIAQRICHLFKVFLSLRQICTLGALFILSGYVTELIFRRLEKHYEFRP